MNRRAKGSGFKMRSTNKTTFKMMGSSPARVDTVAQNNDFWNQYDAGALDSQQQVNVTQPNVVQPTSPSPTTEPYTPEFQSTSQLPGEYFADERAEPMATPEPTPAPTPEPTPEPAPETNTARDKAGWNPWSKTMSTAFGKSDNELSNAALYGPEQTFNPYAPWTSAKPQPKLKNYDEIMAAKYGRTAFTKKKSKKK